MREIITDPAYENREDTVDIAPHMPILEEYASRNSVIVELGCGCGNGSTRALARGLAKSPASLNIHVSVDIDWDKPQIRPDLPYWYVVHGPTQSADTVARVRELLGHRRADLIFIDTDHTYEQMSVELSLWQYIAYPVCTWLFHDTHMGGEYNHMTDAIKEFAAKNGMTYTDLSFDSHGLGVMK